MVREQGLYAQVVMLHRKHLNITEANKNKNKDKLKFQGQSARSKRWFDLDFDWIEENHSTCETGFYLKIYQMHEETQDTNIFNMFEVLIRNTKCAEEISFTVRPQCLIIVKIH